MDISAETFTHHPRGGVTIHYVVVSRKLREAYEAEGERRYAFWMKTNKITAIVTARRARGQKHYQFLEFTGEGGRVWRLPA